MKKQLGPDSSISLAFRQLDVSLEVIVKNYGRVVRPCVVSVCDTTLLYVSCSDAKRQ